MPEPHRVPVASSLSTMLNKSKSIQKIHRLAPERRHHFQIMLEGLQLPKALNGQDNASVKLVSGLADNVLSSPACQEAFESLSPHKRSSVFNVLKMVRSIRDSLLGDTSEKQLYVEPETQAVDTISSALDTLKQSLELAHLSLDPVAYLRFLARTGFDPNAFLPSLVVYAQDRGAIFNEVAQEKLLAGRELLCLASNPSTDSLRQLVQAVHIKLLREEGAKETETLVDAYRVVATVLDWEGFVRLRELFSIEHPKLFSELKMKGGFRRGDLSFAKPIFLDVGLYVGYPSLGGEIAIAPFSRYFKEGEVAIYVISDPEFMHNQGRAAFADGTNILLPPNYHERQFQHELQHAFDKVVLVLEKESELLEQPKYEYRAKLAELAFVDAPSQVEASLAQLHRLAKHDLRPNLSLLAHIEASQMVLKAIQGVGRNELKAQAMELLNKSYEEECGLTYDTILQPFLR